MEYSSSTSIFIVIQFTSIIKEDTYESFSVETRVYILNFMYVLIIYLFNYILTLSEHFAFWIKSNDHRNPDNLVKTLFFFKH